MRGASPLLARPSEAGLGARGAALGASTSGAAYVEFLIAFVPIFLLFLGCVQLSLLWGARLVVGHAANRAVRSAVVVLDDDPEYYGGEARNSVTGPQLTSGQLVQGFNHLGLGGASAIPLVMSRRATVELAAAMPLVALAPRGGGSIGGMLHSDSLDASAAYTVAALEVRFLAAPGSGATPSTYAVDAPVTVALSYGYTCGIPLSGRLICPSGTKTIEATATMTNQGAAYPYP